MCRDYNYKYLQLGTYLVRTQAGLSQALKHFDEENSREDSQHVGDCFHYPSIVTMSVGYRGLTFTLCNWVHVNKMKRFIEGE